jgi:chromobox protein 1/chromobox protein 5
MKPAAVETEIEGSGFRNGAIKKDYTVEKVLNKCTINGKLYYYLKWKNFSDKNNSWEPEENLQCKSLIKEYEAQSKREKKLKKKTQKSIINDRSKYRKKKSTFKNNVKPEETATLINQKSNIECIVEKVLNKCTINGKLYYYLKWKNFSDKNNTWEPEENLQCKSLIKEYETQSKREKKLKKKIQKSIINDRSKYRKKESTITKKTMPEEKVILINQKSSFTQNNSTLKRKIKPNAKVTINNKKITDGTIAGSTSLVKVNPSEDREKDSTLKKYTKPKEKVTLINQKSNFTDVNNASKALLIDFDRSIGHKKRLLLIKKLNLKKKL